METLEFLRKRSSVRRFKPEPLPEEDVRAILAAARQAPTDASAQLYTILRVRDEELRRRLAHLSGDQRHVLEAAEFFVLLADVHRLDQLLRHRGERLGEWPRTALHFAVTDAAIAGAHLAVAAEALGYGICWIGGLLNRVDEVVGLLELPRGVLPVSGLVVGVPAERPDPRPRLPADLVIHEDRYHRYRPEELEAGYAAMAPFSRKGDWLPLLKHYFAAGGVMEARDAVYGLASALQGFSADLPAAAAETLHLRGLDAGSLGEAVSGALEQGWRGVLFNRGVFGEAVVWLEKETAAERGEGRTPGEAFARALAAALPAED
ncbi:nitroreductase family protein [Oceanithermus sp.]